MYKIYIKEANIEKRRKSTGFMHMLAGFFLLLKAADYNILVQYQSFLILSPVYAVAVASLCYGLFRKKLDHTNRFNRWMRLLQAAAFLFLAFFMIPLTGGYSAASLFIWSGICLVLLFSERNLFQEPFIGIGPRGISLPGLYSAKELPWEEIDNLVVRQDYVTLHLPGNKYRQFEVLTEIDPAEMEKIQALCREKGFASSEQQDEEHRQ